MLATVAGVVQGVGYRYFVAAFAAELGLSGYARNLGDGRVEVLAQGDREALDRLAAQLAIGPSSAEVLSVETEWRRAEKERYGFETF